jgi:hypothetical protein
MIKRYLIVVVAFIFLSCDSNNGSEYLIEGQTEQGFEDGTYCADVEYYNPNTGTSNSYKLSVDVEGNEVVKISFGNGGWIDRSHMTPEELNTAGYCSITNDKNYEYRVQITGKDCSGTDNINPETDEDILRYSFQTCTELLNMSNEEIKQCIENGYKKTDLLSEKGYQVLQKYVLRMREINEEYKMETSKIKSKQNKLAKEVKEGYVLRIERRSIAGMMTQTMIISKNGVNYLFEIMGESECTMGTAQFNENSRDWQMVYIKQYPDVEKYTGHYMRIIDSGF